MTQDTQGTVNNTIIVHGVNPSPFVRKVLACLELKGLAYERKDMFPVNVPESFKSLSPLQKIPALQDGDFCISDSSVICEYLHEKYPEISLLPETPELRAKSRWLEEYADSKLAELASGIFFQRMLKPLMGKESNEERVLEIIEKKLPEQFPYLEEIAPEQGFLFGDKLMMADVALVTHFINAGFAGYQIDAGLAPKFAAYFERIKSHPVIAKRMEEDLAFFEAFAKG